MRTKTLKLTALMGVLTLALGACSATADRPAPGSTVQMMGDYPSFSDAESLVGEADLVVEGTAVAVKYSMHKPSLEEFEKGYDSDKNHPLFGLPDADRTKALEELAKDEGTPGTEVSFRVDAVHQGSARPGQVITVVQTGGIIDGVTYLLESEPTLAVGGHYLLFLANFSGALGILGGSAGMYRASENNSYVAVNRDMAPTQRFTTSELKDITR